MARVAYLGPAYSFSHDLARAEFNGDDHVPCENLHGVVEAVAAKQCEIGLVPFYNTTRRSIEEAQVELIGHKNKVFVTDAFALNVRHFLCGFCDLNQIQEIRSKSVVFHQVAKWRKKRLSNVTEKEYESTSLAVQSVAQERPRHAAAIGTHSAAKHYEVPILRRDIQNKPNFTLFFVLRSTMPEPASLDHLLFCRPNTIVTEKDGISKVVNECGCNISTNWTLEFQGKNGRSESAYFFEVDGQYSSLGIYSVVKSLDQNTFLVGGYRERCITSLAWAHDKAKKEER